MSGYTIETDETGRRSVSRHSSRGQVAKDSVVIAIIAKPSTCVGKKKKNNEVKNIDKLQKGHIEQV